MPITGTSPAIVVPTTGGGSVLGAKVSLSVSNLYPVAGGPAAYVTFDTIEFDDGPWVNSGTGPDGQPPKSSMTLPAGRFLLVANIAMNGLAGTNTTYYGYATFEIDRGGSGTTYLHPALYQPAYLNNSGLAGSITTAIDTQAGDILALVAFDGSGLTRYFGPECTLEAYKIGEAAVSL